MFEPRSNRAAAYLRAPTPWYYKSSPVWLCIVNSTFIMTFIELSIRFQHHQSGNVNNLIFELRTSTPIEVVWWSQFNLATHELNGYRLMIACDRWGVWRPVVQRLGASSSFGVSKRARQSTLQLGTLFYTEVDQLCLSL